MGQDQGGTRGGLFADRSEALKFVRFENGTQPCAFVFINETLELDFKTKPAVIHHAVAA